MNWHQARTLAEDHQSRCRVTSLATSRERRRARRHRDQAVLDLRFRLGGRRPLRSLAA
jgi:hypothetical protein